MNTGADDDSLNTPTFAFSKSSARAGPVAVIVSKPANTSRANPIIQFPPSLLFIIPRSHPSALKPPRVVPAEPRAPKHPRGLLGGGFRPRPHTNHSGGG